MAAGLPHAPTPAPPGGAPFLPTPCLSRGSPNTSLSQPATSTPLDGQKAHVTFSDSVIEIADSPKGAEGGGDHQNGKKVPPPPPPRKSSRTTFKNLSPTHGQPKRSFSPPAYENIENLNIKMSGPEQSNGHSGPQVPYNRSVSAPSGVGASPAQGAIAQLGAQGAPKQKPMSKFQHELAAGIYANMNRPDLQGQKVNPASVVTEAHDMQVRDFSDSESTASSQDSQAGLARKMLAAKLDQEAPNNRKQQSPPRQDDIMNTSTGSINGVKMREGKKVPPPPPIRRTSQLSSKQDGTDATPVEEKRRSVSELQKEIMQQLERNGNGNNNGSPPDRNSVTPERNGVLPNQQQKHLVNGDIIRTDASFAISPKSTTSSVTTVTTQHKVTNIHVQQQTGHKSETDIY